MSARVLTYPTVDDLMTRAKGQHGPPAERLMRSYTVEPSGCWRWTGSIAGNGYGHFWTNNAYHQAHLLVYILFVGPLPEGLEPDHLCRNRWCVNPGDIEFVTHAVNSQRGARAVLSPDQARAIRAAHRSGRGVRSLAREHGINHATVSRLINGLIWTNLQDVA